MTVFFKNTIVVDFLVILSITCSCVFIQIEVIEMLYGVFQLRVPTWTQSFTDALASIGVCM